MSFCRYCGKKNDSNTRFCKYCGKEKVKAEEEINLKEEDVIGELLEEDIGKSTEKMEEGLIEDSTNEEIIIKETFEEKITIEEKKRKKKNKKGKGLKIGIGIVILVALCAGGIYLFYDDYLYEKYTNEISMTGVISEKIDRYDKIIKIGKYDEIKEQLIELLKNDMSGFGYIDNMENLDRGKKNEIKREITINLAEQEYLKQNYREAKNLLDRATAYGYSISDEFYKRIEEKIQIEEEMDNSGVEEYEDDIASINGIYIEDSHLRYLTRGELEKYSKEELAFIRNEIYARHGYIFHQEPYKGYYEAKDWYTKNPAFNGDENLNSYEKENIKLIKSME